MRITVEELIDELKKCPPKAAVDFRTEINERGLSAHSNHLQRVDNFGASVTIVVEKGA